jgi:hypothetical protein
MIKIIDKVEVDTLLKYYELVKDELVWVDYGKGKQVSVQYKLGENKNTSGLGKGYNLDSEFNILNEFFNGSVIEHLINKFNLTRTRLMLVNPWSCYSMHSDSTPRIHIPIITNPECYFVFKSGFVIHLPKGFAYHVDTTKLHTFMNCSVYPRLHLMGSVTNDWVPSI